MILSGWKEIAGYLHQGVRTIQRWELNGLPVHRAKSCGQVVAFAAELDAWEKAAPMRLLDEINALKANVEFLKAEVRALKARPQSAETSASPRDKAGTFVN